MLKVYGAPGWGSAISEVMLTLADIPHQFIDVNGFDSPGPQRDLLERLNPLCQVPTLELENELFASSGTGQVNAVFPLPA
jgi:GST-like protein